MLGSATPSLESLERVHAGRATLLSLPMRTAGARPPSIHLIDLRRHAATQGIATPTVLAIQRHLDAGGQVLLYLNRRGYAPALFCPSCGWAAPCPRCDARLTVHQRERRLHCHHCGTEQLVPETCPSCGEAAKPVGQGTERIEEALAQLFPTVALERTDRDADRRRGALEAALDRVTSGAVQLLVGTQMLTKGHHFPDVSLVVVLNADQGLFGTDFRASERLAQSIVQAAGRAGRAERPGEVLIQTEYPEHPLLAQLISGGYDAFATAALAEAGPLAGRLSHASPSCAPRPRAAMRPTPFLDRAREIRQFQPDLLVAIDDNAFRTVLPSLIDQPLAVVFTGMNGQPEDYNRSFRFMESREQPGHNVTGVYEKLHIREAIRIMSHILPDLKKVRVLTDLSPTGKAIARQVALELASGSPLSCQVEPRVIGNWEEFQREIDAINRDRDTGAYYLGTVMLKDQQGKVFTAPQMIEWGLKKCRKPAMPINYSYCRLGLFGGASVDFKAMGLQAGKMVLTVLV